MTEMSKSVLKRKTSLNFLKEFKEGKKCEICGKKEGKMILHHPRPKYDEDNNIAKMIVRGEELEEIEREAKKCQILCHSCHQQVHGFLRKIKTSGKNGWGNIDTSNEELMKLLRERKKIQQRIPQIEKEIMNKLKEMKKE